MSDYSKTVHSLIITRTDLTPNQSINTWDNWHLIPTSRPLFAPPEQKEMVVDLPGVDGSIDLSNSISGNPIFNDRSGSFEFMVMTNGSYGQWYERYSDIMNFIHGRPCKIVLEDDPDWYYEGRIKVSGWTSNSDGSGSTISFDYTVKPYKYATNGSGNKRL